MSLPDMDKLKELGYWGWLLSWKTDCHPRQSDPCSGKHFLWVYILWMPLHPQKNGKAEKFTVFMIQGPIRWNLQLGFIHVRHVLMRNTIVWQRLHFNTLQPEIIYFIFKAA